MHSIAETAVIWKWTMTTIMTGHAAVRIKAAGFHRAQKPVPPFSGKKLTVTTRVLAKITNSFIGQKKKQAEFWEQAKAWILWILLR